MYIRGLSGMGVNWVGFDCIISDLCLNIKSPDSDQVVS